MKNEQFLKTPLAFPWVHHKYNDFGLGDVLVEGILRSEASLKFEAWTMIILVPFESCAFRKYLVRLSSRPDLDGPRPAAVRVSRPRGGDHGF